MAATLSSDAQVVQLQPDQIDPDGIERIGFFHHGVVTELASIIARDGQLEPILVAAPAPRAKDRRLRLVCGRHRLEACRQLGILVQARLVSGRTDELLRMQAAENIDRRDLTVLERAAFVGRRAEIVRENVLKQAGVSEGHELGAPLVTNLSPGVAEGKSVTEFPLQEVARQAKLSPSAVAMLTEEAEPSPRAPVGSKDLDLLAEADAAAFIHHYGWVDDVVAEFGLHRRKFFRLLTIYRGLIKPFRPAVEAIVQCRIADNMDSLLRLASLPEQARHKALQWLAEHPEAKSADEVLVALGISTSKGVREVDQHEGQTKLMTRAETALRTLTPSAWKSWAPVLAKAVKPSALIVVRDALNARIAEIEAKGQQR